MVVHLWIWRADSKILRFQIDRMCLNGFGNFEISNWSNHCKRIRRFRFLAQKSPKFGKSQQKFEESKKFLAKFEKISRKIRKIFSQKSQVYKKKLKIWNSKMNRKKTCLFLEKYTHNCGGGRFTGDRGRFLESQILKWSNQW